MNNSLNNCLESKVDLNGKTILITGGTGSFGKAFVKHVLNKFEPKKLIVFSRDEYKQYNMAQKYNDSCMRYFIGDVRDKSRLTMAMRDVDIVVHAAALKHVPVAEYNPFECIHTNVLGAENIVTAALACSVKKVIALSTDKAVNPINIYGASKLAADKILVAANALSGNSATRFSIVRYGNVIGSRGSIIPYFKQLLDDGCESLPITDKRMTRFWITMEQGVNFVLNSIDMMYGGEVFIPKMPSMKIEDMVSAIAPNVSSHVIGIRPGEKLHEVLITSDDTSKIVEQDERFVICPSQYPEVAQKYIENGANQMPEDFNYSSDSNEDWLDNERFIQLVRNTELVNISFDD